MIVARHRLGLVGATVIATTAFAYGADVHPVDPGWGAPSRATQKANPLAARPELASGGKRIFTDRCAMCHGLDGRGTPDAPDLASADVQRQTDGALFWKISSGNTHGGMPAFSFLPDGQRWQLVLHLRTLPRAAQPRP